MINIKIFDQYLWCPDWMERQSVLKCDIILGSFFLAICFPSLLIIIVCGVQYSEERLINTSSVVTV